MIRPSQISLFTISLFPLFFMGIVLCDAKVYPQQDAVHESFAIEEESAVYLVFQEIYEVTPEISGGYPDTVPNASATTVSTEKVAFIAIHNIKSKHIPECFYLGKLPLYLRYQALKLHC